jgi:hypothetical protein
MPNLSEPDPRYTGPLAEICRECGKAITDDEWVTNWMSCSECMNKSLEEYARTAREPQAEPDEPGRS